MMYPQFGEYKPQPYKEYRDKQMNKTKEKIRMFLNGIKETSLRPEDKIKLINQVKDIVAKY